MASPLGDRIEAKPADSIYGLVLSQFAGDLAERLNVEQMFILIDGVLPFEACLYYQVLPLFIEGSRLHLGMVSLDDRSATDYVRRIVSYHHYSLVPRSISSEALQAVLSAYLNYSGKKQSNAQGSSLASNRLNRPNGRLRADQSIDPALQRTFVVDSPEELGVDDFNISRSQVSAAPSPPIDNAAPPSQPTTLLDVEEVDEIVADFSSEDTPAKQGNDSQTPLPASPSLLNSLPTLSIQTKHLSSPTDVIASLPPHEILQELLGRVLYAGIGRLYFERQPQFGRVLWSQNGVLQSVLERLEIDVFQGVINELKRMTGLPFLPVQKPKQVEVERVYQQNRLLLRFKFMPTENGEEATLQVLRGAALKFYQQQQLANLERDALSIAKQLQTKISEIRDRARVEPGLASAKLDALPALSQLLKHIEHQLGTLQADDEHLEP